jgi:hypothetical protein
MILIVISAFYRGRFNRLVGLQVEALKIACKSISSTRSNPSLLLLQNHAF